MKRNILFYLLIFFAFSSCKKNKTSEKLSYQVNEQDFLLSGHTVISNVNDTIIVFIANEIQLVVYDIKHSSAIKVVDVRNIVNYDSLYNVQKDKIEGENIYDLANKYNSGNVAFYTSGSKVNIINDDYAIIRFNFFCPHKIRYLDTIATVLRKKTYFLKFNIWKNDNLIYEVERNPNKIIIDDYSHSYYYKDTLLVSTLCADSAGYVSQISCYVFNEDSNKVDFVKTRYLPRVKKDYYITAKLPIRFTQVYKNQLYICDLRKIFNYDKGYEVEEKLFEIKNKDELILPFTMNDDKLFYVSLNNKDTTQIKYSYYLNFFNYSTKKHTKKKLNYADKIFGFNIFNEKLYYFEQKGEDYYLNILPVEF